MQSVAPGNPAAYDRINALTDCTALRAKFDAASSHFIAADEGTTDAAEALGSLQAAHSRMVQLDCEGVVP